MKLKHRITLGDKLLLISSSVISESHKSYKFQTYFRKCIYICVDNQLLFLSEMPKQLFSLNIYLITF